MTSSRRSLPLRLPACLALLLSTGLLAAQGENSVQFRTLCLHKLSKMPNLHYLPTPGTAPVGVELPEANLSSATYEADRHTIHFYASPPDPAATKLPPPAATVRIPGSIRSAALLFLPSSETDQYVIMAIDADKLSFRGGDQRFVNLTRLPIAIDLGGNRVALKPGASQALRFPGTDRRRLALQLFNQQGDTWHRFSSTRITADPRIRRLVLCYYDPAEKRVRSRAIWDRVDDPEPAEE
jgi:hypothetical protein